MGGGGGVSPGLGGLGLGVIPSRPPISLWRASSTASMPCGPLVPDT